MGIHWMTGLELKEAIPPIYAEYIGVQARDYISTPPSFPLVLSTLNAGDLHGMA